MLLLRRDPVHVQRQPRLPERLPMRHRIPLPMHLQTCINLGDHHFLALFLWLRRRDTVCVLLHDEEKETEPESGDRGPSRRQGEVLQESTVWRGEEAGPDTAAAPALRRAQLQFRASATALEPELSVSLYGPE
jgi:hypothetical protein